MKSHWHLTIDHILPTTIGVVILIQVGRVAFAKLGTVGGVPGKIGHAGLSLLTFGGSA